MLGTFFWIDRNRCYLIFTGVSMEKGRPYACMQWRQEDSVPNADPNMVELAIPHPITAEIYYSGYCQIDRHNTCRQESFDIKNWVLNIS